MKKLGIEAGAVIENEVQFNCARFSPCGKFLIAAGFDAKVHRWKFKTEGEEPEVLAPSNGHHGWATDIAFHPDKKTIFSSDSWGQLRAWDFTQDAPEAKWAVPEAHDGWIRSISISPDGKQLATCGRDRYIRIFSTADGKPIREFEQQEEDLYQVVFHPSGKWIFSGDLKGKVRQWNPADGKLIREFDASPLYTYHRIQDVGGVRRLGFADNDKTLVVSGGKPATGAFVKGTGHIFIFDIESGEQAGEMVVGKENTDVFVHDFFLHPSGAIISVTSGQPGQGSLIIQRPGEAEADLVHKDKLTNCHSISVHPDGTTIAVASTNRGSNGNGRKLVDGKYVGNKSPIHIFSLVEES